MPDIYETVNTLTTQVFAMGAVAGLAVGVVIGAVLIIVLRSRGE